MCVCMCVYRYNRYLSCRDLNLRGNQLQCEGVVELVRPVVAMLEAEEPCPPPLARLHLQDNSIDDHGSGGTFEPVICARVIKKLVNATFISTYRQSYSHWN